jgi:hypothetical protein
MNATMSETATSRLSDPAPDGSDQQSLRERLGVAAFVVVAVVATTSWIVLLAWGLVQLIRGI